MLGSGQRPEDLVPADRGRLRLRRDDPGVLWNLRTGQRRGRKRIVVADDEDTIDEPGQLAGTMLGHARAVDDHEFHELERGTYGGPTHRNTRRPRRTARDAQAGGGLERDDREMLRRELVSEVFEVVPAARGRAEPPRQTNPAARIQAERRSHGREPATEVRGEQRASAASTHAGDEDRARRPSPRGWQRSRDQRPEDRWLTRGRGQPGANAEGGNDVALRIGDHRDADELAGQQRRLSDGTGVA